MTWLWVALAGGAGAVLRHLSHAAVARGGRPSSWATLGVNVVGSFALGWVVGATQALWPEWAVVGGTGLLGGFTTFSTASVEAAELWRDGRPGAAVALASGMLLASLVAAASGWWLAAR